MNKIEKIVYDRLKGNPRLKYFVRNIYQGIFDLLPRKRNFFINKAHCLENYFFGFHDRSPFSLDNSKILANHICIPLRMPEKFDKLEIGYFDILGDEFSVFKYIDNSFAWNYHKGCRLQWVDNERLIFNTFVDGNLCSKIININTRVHNILSFPIDTVSNSGDFATSFSYERLNHYMPGYGYPYQDNGMLEQNAPANTGLYIVDLINNSQKLLISLSELSKISFKGQSLLDFEHFVTHSEVSPDNRYISFLHRWVSEDILKLNTRLMIFDILKSRLFDLPTDGMVSHYVWNNLNQIIAYCNIDNKDSHVLFSVCDDEITYKVISNKSINSDGHQSFISNTKFVTDTYPDKFRMSKLFVVDSSDESVKLIANIYSPKNFQTVDPYKHIACDLHPRMSSDKKYVCFDSINSGVRSLCIMKIDSND